MSTTLSDIATILNVSCPPGVGGKPITGVAMVADASPTELSFVGAEKYAQQLTTTRAAAVLVQKKVKIPEGVTTPTIIVDNADLAIAKVLELFAPTIPRPAVGVHHSAFVSPHASIADGARIGPGVFVGDECRIGKNVVLHHNVHVGPDVTIGDDCEFFPNVVVRERITIGNRVIIHAGSVLGTDGFGYRWDGTKHAKIPQIGTVIIEDDVEIGSCVCIDRAKFSATKVGRGTKIDNLVQIGHNSQVGPHCILVGQSALAGSVTLGAGVVLGGQSAVRDHVTMGDGSMLAGCSGVMEDVEPKMVVSGLPAIPHRQSLREQAALRQLPELRIQVRKLQEEIEQIKKLSQERSG